MAGKRYIAVNHNMTPLMTEPDTRANARREGEEYTFYTANPHHVVTVAEWKAQASPFQIARWGA